MGFLLYMLNERKIREIKDHLKEKGSVPKADSIQIY